ncbi:hypothetical protein JXO59_12405 [candidate division KSB1 bacterium]|nr:hypothetical protein [candidate division KSB1 bacterium]
MKILPCRPVLYAYETRILFLLVNKDRIDVAREIGRYLRESDVAIDGVFTTPASHRLGSEFLHSLMPDLADDSGKVVDIDINSEEVIGLLEKKVGTQRCEECQDLINLIPASIKSPESHYRLQGCHNFAVAPGSSPAEPSSVDRSRVRPHIVECIIDQRTGQGRLHWLM